MIALVVILSCILYIAIRNPNLKFFFGGQKFPDIFEVQKEIHEFSGVSKESYLKYLENMDNAMETMEPQYLYDSLDNLKAMCMGLAPDSTVPEKIEKLSGKLAKTTEKHIMDYSLKNGIKFAPKYLNNMFV